MSAFLRAILGLPDPASTYAADVDLLHFFVIGVTMLGATGVAGVAAYFAHRYRRTRSPINPERVGTPLVFELAVAGGLLALFLVWWVIGYALYIDMRSPPEDHLEVYVTGKQWMWKFAYPSGESTANVLVVPAGRPVKLNLTSRDVIHSFFVPDFRMKQDALPGRYTTAWFEAKAPGSHIVLCTEYCGVAHSNMRARIAVLGAQDYQDWLDGDLPRPVARAYDLQAATSPRGAAKDSDLERLERGVVAGREPDMATRGKQLAADLGCLACHTLDGRTHIGPSFAGLYRREVVLESGETVVANASYLTRSMMDPRADIVAGFQPVMPTYQGLLEAGETSALVELIRSVQGVERKGAFPGRGPDEDVFPPGAKTATAAPEEVPN